MKQKLKKLWKKYELSCRNSYKPEYIKKFLQEMIKLDPEQQIPEHLIYTKKRYRELSLDEPRVDAEELLIWLCENLGIEPDKKTLEIANKMFGEGSRRELVEEAYLGKVKQ